MTFRKSLMINPIRPVPDPRNVAAARLRTYPRAAMDSCTALRVSSLTRGEALSTSDTVDFDTCAWAATSFIVGRRSDMISQFRAI